MIHVLLWIVLPAVLIPLVFCGIWEGIKHNDLGPKLNDWPRHPHKEMRDSHAKARQDAGFVDGMITGAVLDDLEDMFK